jgi:nucleoside-diphosphate-sugar epimerase
MSNMRSLECDPPVVLVTGSSGLIGSRLCSGLVANYKVVGLDVEPAETSISGIQWIETDLTSDESVGRALKVVTEIVGRRVASVIHLAAYYDFSGAPSPLYRELTVEGTRRLLRKLHEFDVEQFVFSSSLLVMEPVEDEQEALSEDSPTQSQWDYPRSKLMAEEIIRREHGSIPAVILRIAGVYDEDGHSIPIGQQIRRIHERDFESHFFPGDVSHGQPFVHLNDLVECFRRVIELRHVLGPCEVFLIAEDELLSYQELQDRIGELLYGKEWFTFPIPKAVAKAGAWIKEAISSEEQFIKPWMIDLADDHYPVNIAKAKQRLGWQPKHRLSHSLQEIIERLQMDPQRWYKINDLGQPPPEKLGVVVVTPFANGAGNLHT